MKKYFELIFVIVMVLLLSGVSFAARGVVVTPSSSEGNIVVSQAGDGDYESIQDALDNAEEGATILVKAGEYHENLYIEVSGIKLIGEGKDQVKVISSGGESALSVSDVENVEIKGFTFIYSPEENDKGNACVWISDSSGVLFHDNIARGATFSGVEFSNVENSKIYDNIIEENVQSGIFVNSGAKNLLIYQNKCQKNGYHGIEISDEGSNPVIFENKFMNNKESGIYAHDYAAPVIKNNVISENTHSGISIAKSAFAFIIENTITNNKEDGIYVYKNGEIKAISNIIQGNGISGITFSNGVGVVIDNSILKNANFGIDAYAKSKEDLEEINYEVFVDGNIIGENGYSGIGSGGELLHATICKNRIENNKEDGILVYEGAKVDMTRNLILGSVLSAVEVRKGAFVNVLNNTFVKNDTGIYTHDDGYGTYIYNVIAFNKLGIRYKEDKEGKIIHERNVYWKNDKEANGIELGEENPEKDPGFKDAEHGNYKIGMNSEFAGWGY